MSETSTPVGTDAAVATRYRASRGVTYISVATNLVLAVAQVLIGFIGNSQALVADGIHTLSDLITDGMVLFALMHSRKGADSDHPYGHGRIETAVTLLLGIMLFAVALGIGVRAGLRLADTDAVFIIPSVLTIWVAGFTILAKEGLYHLTMVVARRYDSSMLRANAWHHRSDAISSVIVFAGIGGSLYGFAYLDAIAAIVVALMVAKIGIELGWQALRELIDTGLTREDLQPIRRCILSVDGVKALHMLRTRRVGGEALVDVHIMVDDRLSVSEGHHVGESVRERLIREVLPVADVMVHIDTEEDQDDEAETQASLPSRRELMSRLKGYLADIPELAIIDDVTLHYRHGHIDVELLLPLAVAAASDVGNLNRRVSEAVVGDKQIGLVELRFH